MAKFKPALSVTQAKFLPFQPPFITRKKSRGRFATGIRYEKLVHEVLEFHCLGRPGLELRMAQWLEFTDKTGKRWCQVDALILDAAQRVATVFEVKYQHTADAWWQLKQLYEPVLAVALPGYRFRLVEIVHWYDQATQWPQTVRLIPSLNEEWESGQVATLIYNPKRNNRFAFSGLPAVVGAQAN